MINVAGHRLGTREIEEAILSHPAVAEVCTIGIEDTEDLIADLDQALRA